MAKTKALATGFLLFFLISGASAINFDANVEPDANHTAKFMEHTDNVTGLQTANMTVVNTGSVGCSYRLRTVFNTSEQAYSQKKALWPGASAFFEVNKYFSQNSSVSTNLYLQYCGKEKQIDNFNFTAQTAEKNTTQVNSTTLESNSEKVKASLPVEEGLLIPEESPPYWKVPSTEIINGTASIGLEAPIYDSEEELKFSVYNRTSGEIEARTTVSLKEPEPGKWKKRMMWLEENAIGLAADLVSLYLVVAGLLV